VVGWIKRGPSGVIGTNKPDSIETVKQMIDDLPTLTPAADANDIADLLKTRKPDAISYADWRTLDRYEVAQGAAQGRPRVKLTSVAAMLDVIRKP
jgi:ferredoxin--NADP+ reductase